MVLVTVDALVRGQSGGCATDDRDWMLWTIGKRSGLVSATAYRLVTQIEVPASPSLAG